MTLAGRLGKVAAYTYVVGYLVRIVIIAFKTFPQMPFWDWLDYMWWQAFVWGPIWPITLIVGFIYGLLSALFGWH